MWSAGHFTVLFKNDLYFRGSKLGSGKHLSFPPTGVEQTRPSQDNQIKKEWAVSRGGTDTDRERAT